MYKWWLSVFGAGFSPIVPGTCGSAVVAGLFILLGVLGVNPWVLLAVMVFAALHGAFVTVRYGDRAIAEYGPDPSMIVSDEQCGQAITYLGLWQIGGGWKEVVVVGLTGFVLFRIFDIIKPFPVRQLESVRGSWGVLLDDVMAGVYALILLQAFLHLGWLERFWN